ncbi:MAG: sigma-70 family RNA polymerase sigma factor [Candidatus Sungbacteria bacterium]|nr:sigma-70 family RNA polymerase sigma factor [Candidatus Sungbacteria bacterium]
MKEGLSEEEFLAIYDSYAEAIYRHCFFRVFSRELAEDLTQETFIRAWEYAASGTRRVDNWKAFLYRIATNLVIDHSRKKHEENLSQILRRDPGMEPRTDGAADMEKTVLLGEIRQAFKDLKEEEQKLLVLRYIDDLDPKEIAEILETTANNVSVKLHNALKKVKKLL